MVPRRTAEHKRKKQQDGCPNKGKVLLLFYTTMAHA
jgi:hypothetical protein